jgi:hypothetical protein
MPTLKKAPAKRRCFAGAKKVTAMSYTTQNPLCNAAIAYATRRARD